MFETISNSFLTAKINYKGAELISLQSENREYIWNGNPEFWSKHAPVLFPIVGTLKNDKYTYENKEYSLTRHGFARDMDFELITKSECEATLVLKKSQATFELYPFDFELKITYTLVSKKLLIQYEIINLSKNKMPFSIGAHPAFALPEPFDNYSLQFEEQENLKSFELENDLISDRFNIIKLENKLLPLTYSLFEKDALIFKNLKSKKITILENNKPLLNVIYNDFPNFGIWTKMKASFICIEPWYGFSDIINSNGNILDKKGICILDFMETKKIEFTIEIL